MSRTELSNPGKRYGLTWPMGIEVELMAPKGATREMLARRVAHGVGGSVSRFFHPQSESSKVPGTATFDNLTPGFRVTSASGEKIADFVDDLTLQADLDRHARPVSGWHRIISDDARLLQLAMRQCRPEAPLAQLLDPLANLFGTVTEHHATGVVGVSDARGVSVALAAALPGERERPCEIVTGVLTPGRYGMLDLLLAEAALLGFTLPREGATHIHFDAAPLRNPGALAALVRLLTRHGDELKRLFASNPHCVRLGRWPQGLAPMVETEAFRTAAWDAAVALLKPLKLTKYCDFNLVNLLEARSEKMTFELRILPSSLEPEPIWEAAQVFQALLRWCCGAGAQGAPTPVSLRDLADVVLNGIGAAAAWRARLASPMVP